MSTCCIPFVTLHLSTIVTLSFEIDINFDFHYLFSLDRRGEPDCLCRTCTMLSSSHVSSDCYTGYDSIMHDRIVDILSITYTMEDGSECIYGLVARYEHRLMPYSTHLAWYTILLTFFFSFLFFTQLGVDPWPISGCIIFTLLAIPFCAFAPGMKCFALTIICVHKHDMKYVMTSNLIRFLNVFY